MKALYSTRGNRDLATISWGQIEGAAGQFETFSQLLQQVDSSRFGAVTGTVRVRAEDDTDPVEYSLDQLPVARSKPNARLIDAKLELQPIVVSSEIELIALFVEDRVRLGPVPLSAADGGWAIVGRPPGTERESLLFVDVFFDIPGPQTSLAFSFLTKTDLWLSYGLDGEPTGRENQANRLALCRALSEMATRTHGDLELEELAIEAAAKVADG